MAGLPTFTPATIDDNSLTTPQKCAVSHAVSTPDICMIDTSPETGQILAAAIARHSVDRGERVLLVASKDEINQLASKKLGGAQADHSEADRQLTELGRMDSAYRAGRWWTADFWRAMFRPGLQRELDELMTELGRRAAQVPEGVSLRLPAALIGDPRTWDRMIACGTDGMDRDILCRLCARADRWVFIGKLACNTEVADKISATWKALTADTWVREGDRLRCRVRQLTQSQREHLSSEPLSDAPDIELRIYQPENAQPELAEVIFPPHMTFAAAKEFLARDLDEWPIDLEIAGIQWNEDHDRLTALSNHLNGREPTTVEVSPGVHELVADCPSKEVPWSTYGIAFDRAAGWDRQKAEAWLHTHCTKQTRRTVRV
jgi:hypothetical protein